jgi:hypothetical protein
LASKFSLADAFLRRQVTAAVNVELPAVIGAAQAAFLVAREIEAGSAVRAGLGERHDAAEAVAEHDEVLAQRHHPLWRTV